jgi:uncharacterized membrane protein (UPF0127 family)
VAIVTRARTIVAALVAASIAFGGGCADDSDGSAALVVPSEPPGSAVPPALPGDPDRVPIEGVGEIAIEVIGADGEVIGWCLLHADTDERRERGLMEVTDLQGYPGMIFTYQEDRTSTFWMRNTPMPLSIAWIDASGDLVSTADMSPCGDSSDCPSYEAGGAYRTAIEVPQGMLDDMGIEPGARVTTSDTGCAPRATG